jgi:hypothetical protein
MNPNQFNKTPASTSVVIEPRKMSHESQEDPHGLKGLQGLHGVFYENFCLPPQAATVQEKKKKTALTSFQDPYVLFSLKYRKSDVAAQCLYKFIWDYFWILRLIFKVAPSILSGVEEKRRKNNFETSGHKKSPRDT